MLVELSGQEWWLGVPVGSRHFAHKHRLRLHVKKVEPSTNLKSSKTAIYGLVVKCHSPLDKKGV